LSQADIVSDHLAASRLRHYSSLGLAPSIGQVSAVY
jgi:hypothetical protein